MENKIIKDNRFYNLSNLVLSKKKNDFSFLDIKDNKIGGDAYPSNIYGCNLIDAEGPPIDILEMSRNLIKEIENEYNVESTLFLYYPPGGILDWHTNQNFEYYNAICTFSKNGKSFFEYIDDNNKTIRIIDSKGWFVKKSKWGIEKPVFHRALSEEDERITVTFSSLNEEKINKLIENLTN